MRFCGGEEEAIKQYVTYAAGINRSFMQNSLSVLRLAFARDRRNLGIAVPVLAQQFESDSPLFGHYQWNGTKRAALLRKWAPISISPGSDSFWDGKLKMYLCRRNGWRCTWPGPARTGYSMNS